MALESVNSCPICGSTQFEFFLDAIDHTATGEQFHLTRCLGCDLVITNPRPTQSTIDKYYKSDRYISHTGGGTSFTDKAYRAVRNYALNQKLALIARYQSKGNLLDYGCGTGEFLNRAATKGWTATGVEPSAEARARITPGPTVLPDLKDVMGTFNVITLWHVLEHVHDLSQTLATLRKKLAPGGTLIVAVPNPASFDASHYLQNWAAYDVPRHLWHFTKAPMIKLLSDHGLKVIEISPMKFDSFYVSLLSETYTHPGNKLANLARSFLTGLRSNLNAHPDNYSSLIYIAGS